MDDETFAKTTIGREFHLNNVDLPIDGLLDYLSGMKRFKEQDKGNAVMVDKYNKEIEATIVILKLKT